MTDKENKELRTLMAWVAVYTAITLLVAWACGSLKDTIPFVSSIASGLFGAALMRWKTDKTE